MGAAVRGLSAVYVSYDGALDPLGSSQVVPYVLGLAAGVRMTLVSFEKEARWDAAASRERMRARLEAAGVAWRPLRYHARPRLPATAWDVARGARTIRAAVRESQATIVHCRGDVAMTMVRAARLTRARVLYDVRGLFADERVEAGSWARGGMVDRMVRRAEAANLRRADGIVTLTAAARDVLASRRPAMPPHRVIPTCADTRVFRPRAAGETADYSVLYSGSLGGWYLTAEMVAFARAASEAMGAKAMFLTPHVEAARRAGADESWADVREAHPEEVPAWLRRAQAAFFFITPSPAKRASCPTKFAEALATGIPVVANRGVGDLDEVIAAHRVGVLVDGFSSADYARALADLATLLRDDRTGARCRELAESRYGLASAVGTYHGLYREISAAGTNA